MQLKKNRQMPNKSFQWTASPPLNTTVRSRSGGILEVMPRKETEPFENFISVMPCQ